MDPAIMEHYFVPIRATIKLSDIEAARRTEAFAKLRDAYGGPIPPIKEGK